MVFVRCLITADEKNEVGGKGDRLPKMPSPAAKVWQKKGKSEGAALSSLGPRLRGRPKSRRMREKETLRL